MPFAEELLTGSARLIGRDAERARLINLADQAVAGRTAAAVVAGEAGIGKSRLLRELRMAVSDRADVAVGRCLDLGGTPAPYGGIHGLLRELAVLRGAEEVWRAAGPGRSALRLLLPQLTDLPELPGTAPERADAGGERMREAFVNVVESLAQDHPLVLIVEDLHWADEGTLTLLSYLLRLLTRSRLLLLLGWRNDEGRRGDPVRAFLGEAERARLVERITLGRLNRDATRELFLELGATGDDDTLDRLDQRADGVPFFIEELSRCADGPMPDTLRDMLLARYELLDDDEASVVRLISASDAPLEHETLAALSPLAPEALNKAVRAAMRSGILVVEDDRYTFRHALLREAVHDELLPSERSELHRAYAEHLQVRQGADSSHDLHAALAYHWQLAHDRPRALAAAMGAMWSAKSRYAFSTAARFGNLALELWDQVADPEGCAGIDRPALMLRLGSILRNAGRLEQALQLANAALAEAENAPIDAAVHARLLRDKADYLAKLGRRGAVELLTRALEVNEALVHDDQLTVGILSALAGRQMVAGNLRAAINAAEKGWEVSERIGSAAGMAITRNLRGASLAHFGDVEGALADYATARRHAHDPDAQMRYYVNYSDLLNLLGRYREAVQVAEEGHASARALGVERTTGSILAQNLAQALLELGEIERAEDVLARELDLRTFTTFRLYSTLTRVRVLAWRGQAEEAAALLHRYRHELDAVAPMERQVWYYLRQARIAVDQATGDSAAALSSVLLVLDDECPHTLHRVRLLLEAGAVVLAQRINSADADEVAARIADAWSALPNTLRPAPWSRILDALLNPTLSTLHTAVACSDGDDVPAPFRIVTRLALAHALVDAGERPAAADALTQAREAAAALQHEPFITQVREFAHATGLFDDDGAPRLADLTAREAQVLELLTEGLSNGEIGQRLFISVKTVSVHVSAILRKLGVTSRTEAAVLAARGED